MQIVQEVREATDSWLGWLWHGFFSWAAWMVLTLLVWFCCYGTPNLKYDQYNRSLPDKMLETDHFGCMNVGWICLCACFCPGLRWADAIGLAHMTPFLLALCFYGVAVYMNITHYAVCCFGLATCFLMLGLSQQLRNNFGFRFCTCWTCIEDCCFLFWCPWCAISQEARVVQEAYKTGHPSVENGSIGRITQMMKGVVADDHRRMHCC